jgi:hypothetical protein
MAVQFETPGLLGFLSEHALSFASIAEKSVGDWARAGSQARAADMATAAIATLFKAVLLNG